MTEPQVKPYGSWSSPFSSDRIVRGTIGLTEPILDGEDVYWIERRPGEGGRYVIVRRTPDGEPEDITPQPFNARTRVPEFTSTAAAIMPSKSSDCFVGSLAIGLPVNLNHRMLIPKTDLYPRGWWPRLHLGDSTRTPRSRSRK